MSKISIIIVNYNTCALTMECLHSIIRCPPRASLEIIVVDNASVDDSVASIMAEYPFVQLLVNEANLGFAAANNRGIRVATGDYILLLNSDALVTEGALDSLLGFFETHPGVVAAAPRLLNEDGSFQRSFFQFPNAVKVFLHILGVGELVARLSQTAFFGNILSRLPGVTPRQMDNDPMEARAVAYVLFACIMLRKDIFTRLGLMDEAMFFYHEDCEFGYRLARNGLRIWWVPASQVVHLGGGSSRAVSDLAFQNYFRSLLYLFRKHESIFHYWVLKGSIVTGLLLRSFLTPFALYTNLDIPSTYKRQGIAPRPAFSDAFGRVRYYLTLALRALGLDVGAIWRRRQP